MTKTPSTQTPLAVYRHDKDEEEACTQEAHSYLTPVLADRGLLLSLPAEKVFDYDAVLEYGNVRIRLEYKFDKYAFYRMCYEIVSKDRGVHPDMGWAFKIKYDWVVYVFAASSLVLVMEANALRKFVFTRWRELRFFTAHCANANRDITSSWGLYPEVTQIMAALGPKGLAYVAKLPEGMFHKHIQVKQNACNVSSDGMPNRSERLALARVARPLEDVLNDLISFPKQKRWVPSKKLHWDGLGGEHWMNMAEWMFFNNHFNSNLSRHERINETRVWSEFIPQLAIQRQGMRR